MFPNKLVQLIEAHADNLSDALMHRLQGSERCQDLLRLAPPHELKHRSYEIYRHLNEWLLSRSRWEIEELYMGLGVRRAQQGIPYSQVLWAIEMTKECLGDYLQRESLLDEFVEYYGRMELIHDVEHFFDRALYFTALGYENFHQHKRAGTPLKQAGPEFVDWQVRTGT